MERRQELNFPPSQSFDENIFSPEEREEIFRFYHALVFSPASVSDIPEAIQNNPEAAATAQSLLELRNALKIASKGDFSYQITTKGFIGGCLKGLQANLNHVAWLTRRVADGDLDQRMDFMGEFSDAFNSMVKQLSSTLNALEHERQSLEDLAGELQREVEARKETESKLREEEERWKLAVQCSQDGMWEIDLETYSVPYYSPRILELLRLPPESLPALSEWPKLFHSEDHEILALYRRFLAQDNPPSSFEVDHKLRCGDGVYRWFMTRGMALVNPLTQKATRLIGVTADIQDRKEREEHFSHRATHDSLTELPNRVLFDDHLKNSIEFSKRHGSHLAVIMVDVDRFKTINDTLGHYAGDVLLVEIARRLQKSVRESDIVSRFGGDEFAMVLAFGKDEWHGIIKVLNRMMAALRNSVLIEGREISISVSMGISICPEDGDNPKKLMMRADEALYHAKSAGRNACAFWKAHQRYNVLRFDTDQAEIEKELL